MEVTYIEQIVVESRKMRTTRGPGFTTLKVSLKAALGEEVMPSPWPSLTSAVENTPLPEEMKALAADSIKLHWGYWYRDEKDKLCCAFSFHITFEDVGHAKRAEVARLVLKRLKADRVEAAFLSTMIETVFEEAKASRAREDAKRELSWMAEGIVRESRRQAKVTMNYDAEAQRLWRTLSNHTENNAIDMVSTISREHGVDEAELKLAVEKALAEPAHYIGRY